MDVTIFVTYFSFLNKTIIVSKIKLSLLQHVGCISQINLIKSPNLSPSCSLVVYEEGDGFKVTPVTPVPDE